MTDYVRELLERLLRQGGELTTEERKVVIEELQKDKTLLGRSILERLTKCGVVN